MNTIALSMILKGNRSYLCVSCVTVRSRDKVCALNQIFLAELHLTIVI